MGDHLEEKFSHYVPMIMQAAMLYNLIQRMATLHSYYYMPFYKFVEMFTGVIKARDRGKGTQGESVDISFQPRASIHKET